MEVEHAGCGTLRLCAPSRFEAAWHDPWRLTRSHLLEVVRFKKMFLSGMDE